MKPHEIDRVHDQKRQKYYARTRAKRTDTRAKRSSGRIESVIFTYRRLTIDPGNVGFHVYSYRPAT